MKKLKNLQVYRASRLIIQLSIEARILLGWIQVSTSSVNRIAGETISKKENTDLPAAINCIEWLRFKENFLQGSYKLST